MSTSILSFIPPAEHQAIADRTSTYDASADFQEAIDFLAADGGGSLYIPAGTYRLESTIENKKYVSLIGDGMYASTLEWGPSHTGHGIRMISPTNGSTPVFSTVEKLHIKSLAGGGNTAGGGFYDHAGTELRLTNLLISGFGYGVILDQSELVDIELCHISSSNHSAIWLVNGEEASLGNTGAQGGFTNRIAVKSCQLNVPAQFAILDDGGASHSFIDNNYNGGTTHIRAAGVQGLVIEGGEFEAASSRNIYLTYTRLSGASVGRCYAILVAGTIIAPSLANNCIETYVAGHLTLVGNVFANSGDAMVAAVKLAETNSVTSIGNAIESLGPLFQGTAYFRWSAEDFLSGSVTADVGSIPAGGTAFVDLPLTGARVGDGVDQLSASVDLGDDITLTGRVNVADNVRLKLTNTGSAAVDPPSANYLVRIMHRP